LLDLLLDLKVIVDLNPNIRHRIKLLEEVVAQDRQNIICFVASVVVNR
jgi:hypothetical protein